MEKLTTSHQKPIIPTFISTELVTPGKPKRTTLPGIGFHHKEKDQLKLWGQETKTSSKKRDVLAYHHFKPSHLTHGQNGSKVVVTHRHYGSRTCNLNTSEQPYEITTLFLSKCRLNDQRMPKPFESSLVHQYYIREPYPKAYRNSYFSHRCKFQMFPTNGVDVRTNGTISASKFKVKDETKSALNDLRKKYYGTTTYNNNHEKTIIQHKKKRDVTKRKIYQNICKLCGKKINKKQENEKQDENKPEKRKKRVFPFINWLASEENISQNVYPKLPKHCFRPQVYKDDKMDDEEDFCRCKGDVPVLVSCMMVTPSQEKFLNDNDKILKKRCLSKEPPKKMDKENEPRQSGHQLKKNKFERGFKTEARHKFLKDYEEVIPNLSDAVREGKKHDFFGWNVNFFRG